MQIVYRIAADLTVCLHLGYVLFIVLGQVGVMAGAIRGWKWVRNTKFRLLHLIGILVVIAESWLGITCPLTTLENHLRRESGGAAYEGDFIASCVHDTLFFECAPWVFTTIYSLFGLAVVVTLIVCPPRFSRTESPSSETDSPVTP